MFNWENGLIQLFIAATVLTVIFFFFLIATLVRLKNKQMLKEHSLLRSVIEERERSMYMISTEIHDNANQVLNLARMTINIIGRHSVPEQTKYITEAGNMLDNVIAELRNISHSLNADFIRSRGLIDVISERVKWINITHSLHCIIYIEGNPKMFDPHTELMLIRIVQEATNNTLKHAGAEHLWIRLLFEDQHFFMSIKDDGNGFNVDSKNPWNGIGLNSISQRSSIIRSDITISSAVGVGTEIKLSLSNPRYLI